MSIRSIGLPFCVICIFLLTGSRLAAETPKDPSGVAETIASNDAIHKALTTAGNFEFYGFYIEAVQKLAAQFKIPIQFDKDSLNDAGVFDTTPVELHVKGVTLASALNLMLRPIELTWVIRNRTLLITTPVQAEGLLETKVYAVADLATSPNPRDQEQRRADYEALVELISAVVAPTSWSDVGGPGAVVKFERSGAIVVSQTRDIQEEIQRLLPVLRRSRDMQFLARTSGKQELKDHASDQPTQRAISLDLSPDTPATAAVKAALKKQAHFDYRDRPLNEVANELAAQFGINVWLDAKAFSDSGLPLESAVSQKLKQAPLAALLDSICQQLELTWLVRDEVLFISTAASGDSLREIRVYPVNDLVQDSSQFAADVSIGSSSPTSFRRPTVDYGSLVAVITDMVKPTSWSEVGGPGAIEKFSAAGCLVVNQTREVHEEVKGLLAELRRVRDEQGLPSALRPDQAADDARLVVHVFRLALWAEEGATGQLQPAGQGGFFAVNPADEAPGAASATKETQPASPTSNAPSRPRLARPSAKELAEVIPKVIAPERWFGTGGKGSIHAVKGALVVRQTMPVIQQIAEFLKQF